MRFNGGTDQRGPPHTIPRTRKIFPRREITYSKAGESGRSERIRTSDPLYPKQVRYQAAPRSDCGFFSQGSDE